MSFGFLDPWHRFLPRDPQHVVALMGSGGKTSLMLALAAQYREWGVPVVLTTTTRTEALDGLPSYSLAALADCTEPPASFSSTTGSGPTASGSACRPIRWTPWVGGFLTGWCWWRSMVRPRSP